MHGDVGRRVAIKRGQSFGLLHRRSQILLEAIEGVHQPMEAKIATLQQSHMEPCGDIQRPSKQNTRTRQPHTSGGARTVFHRVSRIPRHYLGGSQGNAKRNLVWAQDCGPNGSNQRQDEHAVCLERSILAKWIQHGSAYAATCNVWAGDVCNQHKDPKGALKGVFKEKMPN